MLIKTTVEFRNAVAGTFSIPIIKDPQPDAPNVYHIPTNDHDGARVSPRESSSSSD